MKKTSLSESSILKVLDVLNAAFVWLVRRGELEFNPVLSVKDSLKRKILKRKEKEATEADVIFISELGKKSLKEVRYYRSWKFVSERKER